MVIPAYICTAPWKSLMTKCDAMYYCNIEGVLFNLETDGGSLIFWRQSRGVSKATVWFSGSGNFGILLLKKFPEIPKREGKAGAKLGWQM